MIFKNLIQWLLLGGLTSADVPERVERVEASAQKDVPDGYLQYQENGMQIRVDLPEGDTSFGRSNAMDCSLESPSVDGAHAIFIRESGRYFVKDISDGKTYVNGKEISLNEKNERRQELWPGNIISLGGFPIKFGRRASAVRKGLGAVGTGGERG